MVITMAGATMQAVVVGTVSKVPRLITNIRYLAMDAETLQVNGDNLPTSCPTAPAAITVGTLTLGVEYKVSSCSESGFKLTLVKGNRWGTQTGQRLIISKFTTPLVATVAVLMAPSSGSILHEQHSADLIPTHASSVTLKGVNLRPPGLDYRSVEVYFTTASDQKIWADLSASDHYNSTTCTVKVDLSTATEGALKATLILAGKVIASKSSVGTIVLPSLTAQSGHIAINAQHIVVRGGHLTTTCPKKIAVSNLVLGVDYYVDHCHHDGFILVLLDGKTWGTAGNTLTISKYSTFTTTNAVAIATLTTAFSSSIKPTTTVWSNLDTNIEIEAAASGFPHTGGTWPGDILSYTSVAFTLEGSTAPVVANVVSSTAEKITVAASRVDFSKPGKLYATVTVQGRSTAPVQVGVVTAPFKLVASDVKLALNTRKIFIQTKNTFSALCSATVSITCTVGSTVTALVLGTDFTVSNCGSDGFTASLVEGKKWGTLGTETTGSLKLVTYGSNTGLDTVVATMVGEYKGVIQEVVLSGATDVGYDVSVLTITGTDLKLAGVTAAEVSLAVSGIPNCHITASNAAAANAVYSHTQIDFDLTGLASCSHGGVLLGVVTVGGVTSGPPVQVGRVKADLRGSSYIHKSTANLPNTATEIVIMGLNLKTASNFGKDDLRILFTVDKGDAPVAKSWSWAAVSNDASNTDKLTIQLEGYRQSLSGVLNATIWVAGALVSQSGGTTVASVTTAQHIYTSSQKVAENAAELVVSGHNLPVNAGGACHNGYDDPTWIVITGKVFTTDYYLQSCGPNGFVLRLVDSGNKWGSAGSNLVMTKYGGKALAASVIVGVIVPPVTGGITINNALLAPGQRSLTISGSGLKPSSAFSNEDISVVFSATGIGSNGKDKVFRGTVSPAGYTDTSMLITSTQCGKNERLRTWRAAKLSGTNSDSEREANGLIQESPLSWAECEQGEMGQDVFTSLSATDIKLNLTIAGVLVPTTPKKVNADYVPHLTNLSQLNPISKGLSAPVLVAAKRDVSIRPTAHSIATDAASITIDGFNLPSDCSSYTRLIPALVGHEAPQQAVIKLDSDVDLAVDVDYTVSTCTTATVTLQLKSGKVWGAAGKVLRATAMGLSGLLDVQIGFLVGSVTPVLTLKTATITNTQRQASITGTGLLPAGTTESDVSVTLSVDRGNNPRATIEPGSWTALGGIISIEGLSLCRRGALWATVMVAGKVTAKKQIGTITEPVIVEHSQLKVSRKTRSFLVRGYNLPTTCPNVVRLEGLSFGMHYNLHSCTREGFILNLVGDALWGPHHSQVRLVQYGDRLFSTSVRIAWIDDNYVETQVPAQVLSTLKAAETIPDQSAGYGYFEYSFSQGLFTVDSSGGSVRYNLEAGDPLLPLPSWLKFDPTYVMMHGQPVTNSIVGHVPAHAVNLVATDNKGGRAAIGFTLQVVNEREVTNINTKSFFNQESFLFDLHRHVKSITIANRAGAKPIARAHATAVEDRPIFHAVHVSLEILNAKSEKWERVWHKDIAELETFSFDGLSIELHGRSVSGIRWSSSPDQDNTFHYWSSVALVFKLAAPCGQVMKPPHTVVTALSQMSGRGGSTVYFKGYWDMTSTYELRVSNMETQHVANCGHPGNSTVLSCMMPSDTTSDGPMRAEIRVATPECYSSWNNAGSYQYLP